VKGLFSIIFVFLYFHRYYLNLMCLNIDQYRYLFIKYINRSNPYID